MSKEWEGIKHGVWRQIITWLCITVPELRLKNGQLPDPMVHHLRENITACTWKETFKLFRAKYALCYKDDSVKIYLPPFCKKSLL